MNFLQQIPTNFRLLLLCGVLIVPQCVCVRPCVAAPNTSTTGVEMSAAVEKSALPPNKLTLDQRSWNIAVNQGTSQTLLIIGSGATSSADQVVTIGDIVKALREKATTLNSQKIAFATVLPASFVPPPDKLNSKAVQDDARALNLVADDEKGTLSKMFHADPAAVTVVQIDRAGFLRQVVSVPLTKDFGTVLQSIKPVNPVLELNRPAPDFLVPDLHGRMVSIAQYRGRKNVLLTFAGDIRSCSCSSQILSFAGREGAFAQSDTAVFSVSPNAAEGFQGQQEYAKTHDVFYPMIPDPQGHLASLYGVWNKGEVEPMTVLIDKDGIVRSIERKVEASTHGDDMLARLKELKMID